MSVRQGWRATVNLRDIFHNEELALEQKAVAIRSAFRAATEYGYEIADLMDELVDAGKEGSVEWFDDVWSGVYDWADDHRVWVAIR